MSADWQVGDLALCVAGRGPSDPYVPSLPGHKRVRRGGVYLVAAALPWWDAFALVFAGHHSAHPSRGWDAGCFIKVTPPEADEFDRETIELLNRKPVEASWQSIARELRLEREGL